MGTRGADVAKSQPNAYPKMSATGESTSLRRARFLSVTHWSSADGAVVSRPPEWTGGVLTAQAPIEAALAIVIDSVAMTCVAAVLLVGGNTALPVRDGPFLQASRANVALRGDWAVRTPPVRSGDEDVAAPKIRPPPFLRTARSHHRRAPGLAGAWFALIESVAEGLRSNRWESR